MVYVTSDIHGWPLESFLQLLDRAKFGDDDFLFVLGDVVDRNGDGGVAFLRWMMLQPNVQLILGNHEDMLLNAAFLFDEITQERIDSLRPDEIDACNLWLYNGAGPTIDSMRRLKRRDPEAVQDILDYLTDAPLYESVETSGGDFLLVHSGLGNFDPMRPISAYSRRELLWCRPQPDDRYFGGQMTVILGHTPVAHWSDVPDRMFRGADWIGIDTGAGSIGKPMLLRLDDLTPFYAS